MILDGSSRHRPAVVLDFAAGIIRLVRRENVQPGERGGELAAQALVRSPGVAASVDDSPAIAKIRSYSRLGSMLVSAFLI